jgi:hypothetical protein
MWDVRSGKHGTKPDFGAPLYRIDRLRSILLIIRARHLQQPLAAPDADNPDAGSVNPIDDAERRIDYLAQIGHPKLRHDAPAFRKAGEAFRLGDELPHQASPHLGHLLIGVPGEDILEIEVVDDFPRIGGGKGRVLGRPGARVVVRGDLRGLSLTYQRRLLAKACPEPDFRYFSKAAALASSVKAR